MRRASLVLAATLVGMVVDDSDVVIADRGSGDTPDNRPDLVDDSCEEVVRR